MDKNLQLLFWGAAVTLCTGGIAWMVSTLVSVDKRTEIMDVKIDHLVFAIEGLQTERQAFFDKSWTDVFSNIQVTTEER